MTVPYVVGTLALLYLASLAVPVVVVGWRARRRRKASRMADLIVAAISECERRQR